MATLTSSNNNKLYSSSAFTPPRHVFQIREFRVFRRRRLKRLAVRCQNPNLLTDLISSPISLQFIAPALAGAAVVFFSNFSGSSHRGEWLLLTSPTPFNRFVRLRCPSIVGKPLEDDDRLVKEGGHLVRVDGGGIELAAEVGSGGEERLEYQRVCVSTDDGGVLSLDWPANLELNNENGLDTTLILVPGTADGSKDRNVKSFVCEALGRGCFPIVVNPRGCAGSPLTTPRLFSAADSDDISTAIQFINKARSGTTLMGVGWGYGANMLTKYLAEVGERTPLTAATCIDNPFDLEEATRSSPHQMANDQQLLDGLIEILRSNKELFQGKAKGFDVEQALSAKSVREFEKAVSMFSYGCEDIEDFYSKSNTKSAVRNVKIPVLYIQKDDGSAPLFSIPRSLIAENPFTSLLLCSCLPSRVFDGGRFSLISWCQHLTIEWLTAVELGLLKGRHPLLEDVDLRMEPSKSLAIEESDTAASFWLKHKKDPSNGNTTVPLNQNQSHTLNGYTTDTRNKMLRESDAPASFGLISRNQLKGESEVEHTGLQNVGNGALDQTNSVDSEQVNEEEVSPADGERGQVLQTAQVVMNMLDVTMPDILTEERKKKVLAAIGRGDTLMTAMQDAVPEDVRGNLTAAVTGALQAQGTNLNFDQLLSLKSTIRNKFQGVSSSEGAHQDQHSSDQLKKAEDLLDSSDSNQLDVNKPPGELQSDNNPSEISPKILTVDGSLSNDGSDVSDSVRKDTGDPENGNNIEKGSESDTKPNDSSLAGSVEGEIVKKEKDISGKAAQVDAKDEEGGDNPKRKDKDTQPVIDQIKSSAADSAEGVVVKEERDQGGNEEGNDNEKSENKNTQPIIDQPKSSASESNSPTFNVSEAFEALTGMDDSTQLAVNNVFGVLENMIDQLEESSEHENEENEVDSVLASETSEKKIDSVSESETTKDLVDDESHEDSEASKTDQSVHIDGSSNISASNCQENDMDLLSDTSDGLEEKVTERPVSVNENGTDSSQGSDRLNCVVQDKNAKKAQLVGVNRVNNIPPIINSISNGVHDYLLSKVRTQSLDLDATTSLLLDYFPEEGQWKLLEEPGHVGGEAGDVAGQKVKVDSPAKENDEVIEPSYVILDTEKHQELVKEYGAMDNVEESIINGDEEREEFVQFVKRILLDVLSVEVGRRLIAADVNKMELAQEMEQVANSVSLSVRDAYAPRVEVKYCSNGSTCDKVGTLRGEHVIRAISSAVQDTRFLRRAVPVGVIVGSALVELRKYFIVATLHDNGYTTPTLSQAKISGEKDLAEVRGTETQHIPVDESDQNTRLDSSVDREDENPESKSINNTVMVGAVTAALGASAIGASALLADHQDSYKGSETSESSSESFKMKDNGRMETGKFVEAMPDKSQNSNIVTSLAEKAMSVAAPVVPHREDGGVDQERLVAMLAELGQRGGMLRLVGKLALLWGGMRGAMSLTDKLIQFLHLSKRPLIQRILGFVGMALVLWSPVAVPLLPTFLQSWATKTPSRIAELASIIGLYTAFMILVILWGKRIRGYEDPLKEYGMDMMSLPKLFDFSKGLIGGVVLVLSIQSTNVLLGCVNISWPSAPTILDSMKLLKAYGQVITLAGQGLLTAIFVSAVEEVLFRSWLPQEIGADLGYYRGIIISGLAFSLCQRSLWAIPGLWILSLGLSGARQRNQGSLAIPVGLRAGIIASSFVLQRGGFLTYRADAPLWIIGSHQFQPFSGLTGFAFALVLAIVLHPTEPLRRKIIQQTIEE